MFRLLKKSIALSYTNFCPESWRLFFVKKIFCLCYLKLSYRYELHILSNKKVSAAKDHGKNYIMVRLLLARRLMCNRLLANSVQKFCCPMSTSPHQTKLSSATDLQHYHLVSLILHRNIDFKVAIEKQQRRLILQVFEWFCQNGSVCQFVSGKLT